MQDNLNRELRELGWKIIRICEHELREGERVAVKVMKVWDAKKKI